jgi:hypothetical protein
MSKLTDLRFLFRVVALLELSYMVAGLMPPSLVTPATGWILSPDGHWITKLMAVALGTQAWIAWVLRDQPHVGVARALGAYQLASATVDWVAWLTIDGVFSNSQARVGVVAAIVSHYILGALVFVAIRRETK